MKSSSGWTSHKPARSSAQRQIPSSRNRSSQRDQQIPGFSSPTRSLSATVRLAPSLPPLPSIPHILTPPPLLPPEKSLLLPCSLLSSFPLSLLPRFLPGLVFHNPLSLDSSCLPGPLFYLPSPLFCLPSPLCVPGRLPLNSSPGNPIQLLPHHFLGLSSSFSCRTVLGFGNSDRRVGRVLALRVVEFTNVRGLGRCSGLGEVGETVGALAFKF